MTTKTQKVQEPALKLIDLYQESQQIQEQEEMLLEVRLAKIQLDSDILATEKSVGLAKKALNEALRTRPFNSQNIINAQYEVKGYEQGLKDLQQLKKLF